MYNLEKPKLKFELFLIDNSKANNYNRNTNNSNRVVCFSDSYDISSDGSITFYQTAKVQDKRVRIPVLSYPSGKWEAVLLLDDNNYYPVFNSTGLQIQSTAQPLQKQPNSNENIHELQEPEQNYRYIRGSNTEAPTLNTNVPGVSNNPKEFLKSKNEWLEKSIKEYIKSAESFRVAEYISSLQKDGSFRQYKPTETDVEWAASALIKDRQVAARKFIDPVIQKNIGLILPDLMKRQWSGKMMPILESLTDREEAKNATAIDLAVWMAQNGIN